MWWWYMSQRLKAKTKDYFWGVSTHKSPGSLKFFQILNVSNSRILGRDHPDINGQVVFHKGTP